MVTRPAGSSRKRIAAVKPAPSPRITPRSRTIPQNHAQVQTLANGGKYVPMGAVFPSNDENAIGIVYEDVDVTTGAMPGSVVTKGTIYADRLPTALANAAKTALAGKGFRIIDAVPTVTRPYN